MLVPHPKIIQLIYQAYVVDKNHEFSIFPVCHG
jgi:hypothetical protein